MKQCYAKNHPPGCQCGYNPHYVDGNHTQAPLHHYSKGQKLSKTPAIGLVSYRSSSSRNHGTECKYCGKRVYYVEHNEGKVFFDELGWPWPIHDCQGLRGKSLRPKLTFQGIILNQSNQPILCKVVSWIKREDHLYAHLETMDFIPIVHYIKLMSKTFVLSRDSIVVVFLKNLIYTVGNRRGELSQVQDCDKSWYEMEFRKMRPKPVLPTFSEIVASSGECVLVKKPQLNRSRDSNQKAKASKEFYAVCNGHDSTYFYFQALRGPMRVKEKSLVIRVAKDSENARKHGGGFKGELNEKVTLIIGSISKKGICEAFFPKK
jgi:hypothetical protein